MKNCLVILLSLLSFISFAVDFDAVYKKANTDFKAENYADALNGYESIIFDPASDDFPELGSAFSFSVECLSRLGKIKEFDQFLEKALKIHPDNWRLVASAAGSLNTVLHYGKVIDGKFERGHGWRSDDFSEKDRVMSIQLFLRALKSAETASSPEKGKIYLGLAQALLETRKGICLWRFQELTDLEKYSDISTCSPIRQLRPAPVDKDGNPLFYKVPESFESAKSDGERFHWAVAMAEKNGSRDASILFADFLNNQFGVGSLGRGRDMDSEFCREKGPYSLYALPDDETIAELANGVSRFKMPDEFNFIRIYKAAGALDKVSEVYIERRQLEKAAGALQKYLESAQGDQIALAGKRLERIVKNLGYFLGGSPQVAGRKARLGLYFRNAKEIKLSARRINLKRILDDFKAAIVSGAKAPDLRKPESWIEKPEYIGESVAEWTQKLSPAPHHWRNYTVLETPLSEAGAYLLEGKFEGGGTCRIIVWIENMVLIWKGGDKRNIFIVCDAASGAPLPNAEVEVFRIPPEEDKSLLWDFTMKTDGNGIAVSFDNDDMEKVIIAATTDGRLAFFGPRQFDDLRYDCNRVFRRDFCMTDRPVYRPGDVVKFRIWSMAPCYTDDEEDTDEDELRVIVSDPDRKSLFDHTYELDEWSGVNAEFKIPENAKLGVYSISGGGEFRVEEYKKPEFEVSVEAPKEAIKLGDKFTASIKARYYFGTPVANAKVKYRVSRRVYRKYWIPETPWDWLYGAGGMYFSQFFSSGDYARAEFLFEKTADIGPDGTLKVEINTAGASNTDSDYEYRIAAEVTDSSRHTISNSASVVASAKPFKVFLWASNGYFKAGESVNISAASKTYAGVPVAGKGTAKLFKITYEKGRKPLESLVRTWPLDISENGETSIKINTAEPGQFKLVYTVTDSKNNSAEGSYSFTVFGDACPADSFRFKHLELLCDKSEYSAGDEVDLVITSSLKDAYVYLFVRAKNYLYPMPELIKLDGNIVHKKIKVEDSDMPDFFVAAFIVSNAVIYSAEKEIIVPPRPKILNVEVVGAKEKIAPGGKTQLKIRITDLDGKPVKGQAVVAVYDKSLEYISAGSNVPPIVPYFWSSRYYLARFTIDSLEDSWDISERESCLDYGLSNFDRVDYDTEDSGDALSDYDDSNVVSSITCAGGGEGDVWGAPSRKTIRGLPYFKSESNISDISVRKHFADTAYWTYGLVSGENGEVLIDVVMPENLSTWKVKAWTMASGCRVGEGETEIITSKDFIVRLEAPRFFVEGDEAVLFAIIHNYHKETKKGTVSIALDGDSMKLDGADAKRDIEVAADSEKRVDWRVKALKEGKENITTAAGVNGDSDGVKMSFPVLVHGMKKQVSFSGFIPADKESGSVTFSFDVPEKRRTEASLLSVKCRPTLAGVLTDALPFLVQYPYGCAEQTLNSFIPAIIVRDALKALPGISSSPELEPRRLEKIINEGFGRLMSMQGQDGGWGWFAGCRESSAHITSIVLHGLKLAEYGSYDSCCRGRKFLDDYQKERLKDIAEKKCGVGDIDALVFSTLAEFGDRNEPMKKLLFEKRKDLSLYGKSLFVLGLDPESDHEILEALLKNIEQYLVRDSENQTAFLDTPRSGWWFWYNDDIETQANYLRLLMKFKPSSDVVPGLVKYLICNRKNATYWKSTRDTAYCVEALLEYFKKSGEADSDMEVDMLLDGKIRKNVRLNKGNLFSSDASISIAGSDIKSGKHHVEIRKKGKGRLYCDAAFSYFSLEDFIKAEGLDIKVRRNYYLLKKKSGTDAGFEKVSLEDTATVKSGEDVEVELVIESKNDYEYILFEDMKPAGFECQDVRSGYTDNSLGAYVEYRDTKVAFFVSYLPRGTHNLIYRLRAETAGKFSALPARGEAMYSPEIKANSNEMKIGVNE